jgi:hypothetical protein
MKDLKNYSNKTKAAFILLIVMLLIILSNFNTLQNSKKVNQNINAIYKDRLVVAHYIFQYAKGLHYIQTESQKVNLSDNVKQAEIGKALQTIRTLDDLYVKTVLTPNEKAHFESFLNLCKSVATHTQNKNWNQIGITSDQALKTLDQLSDIQIKEGKLKLASANAMYSGNNSLGQLQIALLIILGGITCYLLIIKKTKKTIKIPEPPSMN